MIPDLPSDTDAAFMYKFASHYLQLNGYDHYEVSSYAKKFRVPLSTQSHGTLKNSKDSLVSDATQNYDLKAKRSHHNQIYWGLDSQWYAFGLGATSYVNRSLFARPRTLFDYQNWVAQIPSYGNTTMHHPSTSTNIESSHDVNLDLLMNVVLKRLRTSEGLCLNWIQRTFSTYKKPQLGKLYVDAILSGTKLAMDLGFATFDEEEKIIRLNQPDGFLYSNTIISDIFIALEEVK
jgi:coproporphyrinogen III oxidase-like Fe-S oxidoreductase